MVLVGWERKYMNENKVENEFKPSEKAKKASERFMQLLTSGKIEKEVLLNTSEDFNVSKVSRSIENLSKNPNFLAISNL